MAINTVNVLRRCIDITGFTCDRCKKEYKKHPYDDGQSVEESLEYQESLTWRHVGGYGSVIGDGNSIEFTLCQYCWFEIFKPFAKVKEYRSWV